MELHRAIEILRKALNEMRSACEAEEWAKNVCECTRQLHVACSFAANFEERSWNEASAGEAHALLQRAIKATAETPYERNIVVRAEQVSKMAFHEENGPAERAPPAS